MKSIKVTVKNRIATASERVVSYNLQYQIVFDFDEEWEDAGTKTMRVETVQGHTDVEFTGDTVSLPLVSNATVVKIGVYAGSLATTTPARLDVIHSILDKYGNPVDPIPSVYDQIMEALSEKADRNQGRENVGKYWKVGEDGELVLESGGGASTWSEISEKPFSTIGSNLKVVNGALMVDTADAVEQDNTKPVTSAAVHTEIGNIEALLAAL